MAENPRFSPFSTNWTPERVMLGIKHVSNADVHSTPQSNKQSCQHWRLQWTGGGGWRNLCFVVSGNRHEARRTREIFHNKNLFYTDRLYI